MAVRRKPTIKLKRAYEPPAKSDGRRLLVDRVWPRGVSKEALRVDAWVKDVAPSAELRKWFAHDPAKWDEFKAKYFAELDRRPEAVRVIADSDGGEVVTLVFGAKDVLHNNAVALKEYLESRHRRRF